MFMAGVAAVPAFAACGLDAVVREFDAGHEREQAGDAKGAIAAFRSLARQGIGPAQFRLAQLEQKSGDPSEAAFWAHLASLAGDRDGRRLDGELAARLAPQAGARARERAAAWRPELPECLAVGELVVHRKDATPARLGRFGIAISANIPKEGVDFAVRLLPELVSAAQAEAQWARAYVPLVDGIEVFNSDRYDRFVGWQPGNERQVLQVAVGNFLDDSIAFAGRAVAMEAARRLYSRLSGSELIDPYFRRIAGKRVYGSIYPDIKNDSFFQAIERALRLTEKLPKDLLANIDIIDEIRYNPSSRHFSKSGTIDVAAAYFHKGLSGPGRHIVFLRRDQAWSSDYDLFLSLVHEGHHAIQDDLAKRYQAGMARKEARLAELSPNSATDAAEAKALRQEMARERDYIQRWINGKETARGRQADIAFECEAVAVEVAAARAIDAPPSAVEDSQYLNVCDEAKILLVRWKDHKLLNGGR